jgi:hypothetical protein
MADRSPQCFSDKTWQTWLRCRLRLFFMGPVRDAPAPGDFSVYEAGKKRRYELFFAVNGGAFAVASWLWDDSKTVGALKLAATGYGLAGFTWLMSLDLFAFGLGFRRFFGRAGRLVIYRAEHDHCRRMAACGERPRVGRSPCVVHDGAAPGRSRLSLRQEPGKSP